MFHLVEGMELAGVAVGEMGGGKGGHPKPQAALRELN
jgi:hypothetical protein